jgi:hypothetical protein
MFEMGVKNECREDMALSHNKKQSAIISKTHYS